MNQTFTEANVALLPSEYGFDEILEALNSSSLLAMENIVLANC